jgi:hypothetical protein
MAEDYISIYQKIIGAVAEPGKLNHKNRHLFTEQQMEIPYRAT